MLVSQNAMNPCILPQAVMEDPVVAQDGFAYERNAIARWLASGRASSPMTNLPLASPDLTPNHSAHAAIAALRAAAAISAAN